MWSERRPYRRWVIVAVVAISSAACGDATSEDVRIDNVDETSEEIATPKAQQLSGAAWNGR
jgi:hypothetical protein